MRKYRSVFFTACILSFVSCNFSVGTNKDLITGLHYSYNGFGVDEVLLVGPDNSTMSNNEVSLNSKVAIVVQGLANYELQDGKAFPGLMLKVTDKGGVSILEQSDLFANSDGFAPDDAAYVRGTVTVGEPMKPGQSYHMEMRVWDKNKPENELTAEVEIVVK